MAYKINKYVTVNNTTGVKFTDGAEAKYALLDTELRNFINCSWPEAHNRFHFIARHPSISLTMARAVFKKTREIKEERKNTPIKFFKPSMIFNGLINNGASLKFRLKVVRGSGSKVYLANEIGTNEWRYAIFTPLVPQLCNKVYLFVSAILPKGNEDEDANDLESFEIC
jgi:hypothetical protein